MDGWTAKKKWLRNKIINNVIHYFVICKMLPGLRDVEAESCEADFVFSVDVFRCDESLFSPRFQYYLLRIKTY